MGPTVVSNDTITPASATITISGALSKSIVKDSLTQIGTITPFTVPRFLYTSVVDDFGNRTPLVVLRNGQVFMRNLVDWPAGMLVSIGFNRINCV